jgi:hypothetical protein
VRRGGAGRGGNGDVVRGSVDLRRKRVEQAGGGEMGEDNRQISDDAGVNITIGFIW